MKSGHRPAFIMSDSLVALFVILLSINLFVLNRQFLTCREQADRQRLIAARLAKEASDQYQSTHQKVRFKQGDMLVQADQHQVFVFKEKHCLLQVRRS